MLEGETVYASNFRRGPKWVPGVLKQSTSPTSFVVQLEDGRLLRRQQDHLIQRSSVLQASIPNQEEVPADLIAASGKAKQPELRVEETPTSSLDTPAAAIEPLQSAPQGVPEKRYPTRNRHAPRYLADFVTK